MVKSISMLFLAGFFQPSWAEHVPSHSEPHHRAAPSEGGWCHPPWCNHIFWLLIWGFSVIGAPALAWMRQDGWRGADVPESHQDRVGAFRVRRYLGQATVWGCWRLRDGIWGQAMKQVHLVGVRPWMLCRCRDTLNHIPKPCTEPPTLKHSGKWP